MSKILEIVEIVEDENDETFELTVRFKDICGKYKEHSISRDLLNQPRATYYRANEFAAHPCRRETDLGDFCCALKRQKQLLRTSLEPKTLAGVRMDLTSLLSKPLRRRILSLK